jgi:hypothetical protein
VVYKPNKKELSEAIKMDIVAMLMRSEEIGVFELRRIEQITRICVDLLNSLGTPHEGVTFVQVLKRIEDICPSVNALLANSVFDGEAALGEAYRVLTQGFSETFKQEMKVLGEQREQLQRDRENFSEDMRNERILFDQHRLSDMRRIGAIPTAGALPTGRENDAPLALPEPPAPPAPPRQVIELAANNAALDTLPGWRRKEHPSYPNGEYYEHETALWHDGTPLWLGYSERQQTWLYAAKNGTDRADSREKAAEAALSAGLATAPGFFKKLFGG